MVTVVVDSVEGRTDGRKEGRKDGRTGGGKEGRKEGRTVVFETPAGVTVGAHIYFVQNLEGWKGWEWKGGEERKEWK
jgi:hypothetical protein